MIAIVLALATWLASLGAGVEAQPREVFRVARVDLSSPARPPERRVHVVRATVASARAYARAALGERQWGCFDELMQRESGWDPTELNPDSGAYGIPQALPGSKMRVAGRDWRTNPVTQVRWAIEVYIPRRYGSPCAALSFWDGNGWY